MQMKVIDELVENSPKTLSLFTAFVSGTSSTLQLEEPKNSKELVERYHQAQISKKCSGDSKRVVQSTGSTSRFYLVCSYFMLLYQCHVPVYLFVPSLTLQSFGSS